MPDRCNSNIEQCTDVRTARHAVIGLECSNDMVLRIEPGHQRLIQSEG